MKYINYKKIICIILSGFIIVTTGCENKEKQEVNQPQIETQIKNDDEIETKEDEVKDEIKDNVSTKEDNKITEFTNNDKEIIDVFNNLKKQTETLLNSEKSENTKDKLKGIFITVVDFIFCDGEIKGIKFDDLTSGAKENILNTTKEIDEAITKVYPTYKEDISKTTKEVYTKASELIKKGANNINEFAKDKLGDENYKTLVMAKDELVYYTKNAISIIGDFSSSAWEVGKDKVLKWYYNFKTGN